MSFKKFLVLVVFTLLTAPSAHAAFSSVAKSTFTAGVSFASAGEVSYSIAFENLVGGTTTQVYWTPGDITIGSTDWRRADSRVVLYSTITAATGGIQIYTDNSTPVASPQYTGSNDPAGLVAVEDTSADPLQMCWRIVDASTDTLTIDQNGSTLYSTELGVAYPCFLWMKDASGPSAMTGGEEYVTMRESGGRLQHAEGTWADDAVSPDYIYFGAKFTNALTPRTYQTSTLRIEAFTE
ncbi:hypothetical protein ACFL58_00590 [Elusimicrobiota bacterium]